MRLLVATCVLLGGHLLLPPHLFGKIYLTHQQALTLAFPAPQSIERMSLTLSADRIKAVKKRSGVPLVLTHAVYYVGKDKERITGYAMFDTATVKTMPVTIMVAADPKGTLRFVEIVMFEEPGEYKPPKRWLASFRGRRLGRSLRVGRGLGNLAGATLSAFVVTDSVRKILALMEEAIIPTPRKSSKEHGLPPTHSKD